MADRNLILLADILQLPVYLNLISLFILFFLANESIHEVPVGNFRLISPGSFIQ